MTISGGTTLKIKELQANVTLFCFYGTYNSHTTFLILEGLFKVDDTIFFWNRAIIPSISNRKVEYNRLSLDFNQTSSVKLGYVCSFLRAFSSFEVAQQLPFLQLLIVFLVFY